MTVVVTVELWPGGDEARKRHLGTARIVNDATGTATVGHYDATFSKRGSPTSVWRRSRVTNFPRKRLGAWDLLCAALVAALGGLEPGGLRLSARRGQPPREPF